MNEGAQEKILKLARSYTQPFNFVLDDFTQFRICHFERVRKQLLFCGNFFSMLEFRLSSLSLCQSALTRGRQPVDRPEYAEVLQEQVHGASPGDDGRWRPLAAVLRDDGRVRHVAVEEGQGAVAAVLDGRQVQVGDRHAHFFSWGKQMRKDVTHFITLFCF